jgi:HEPN domain-containing protein
LAAEVPEAWLDRANDDLLIADLLLESVANAVPEHENAFATGALFHAQQAAEKAMKALLLAERELPPRTHDLGALADRCVALAPELESALTNVDQLSPYAVRIRYPGEGLDLTTAEVAERVEIARTCLAAIRGRLSQT